MTLSGIPPAVYVQVIIRCITAKAGYGMGSFGSPCFLRKRGMRENQNPNIV